MAYAIQEHQYDVIVVGAVGKEAVATGVVETGAAVGVVVAIGCSGRVAVGGTAVGVVETGAAVGMVVVYGAACRVAVSCAAAGVVETGARGSW